MFVVQKHSAESSNVRMRTASLSVYSAPCRIVTTGEKMRDDYIAGQLARFLVLSIMGIVGGMLAYDGKDNFAAGFAFAVCLGASIALIVSIIKEGMPE